MEYYNPPFEERGTGGRSLRVPDRVAKTGTIWNEAPEVRAAIVHAVCSALEGHYGHPRLGNPDDPTDDLVYIIVSNRTTPERAATAYQALKRLCPTWDALPDAPMHALRAALSPAGLASVKSGHLVAAFRKMRTDFGSCDLSRLRDKPTDETLTYLVSLPGVSDKVARCVMMYTLGSEVLPVDAHVHRVTRRLGWTARKRADQSHAELESLVPPAMRYAFHVDCIVHGRTTCRPTAPACSRCPVIRHCAYKRKV